MAVFHRRDQIGNLGPTGLRWFGKYFRFFIEYPLTKAKRFTLELRGKAETHSTLSIMTRNVTQLTLAFNNIALY